MLVSFADALKVVQASWTSYHVHNREIDKNDQNPPREETLRTTKRFIDCFWGPQSNRGVLMHAGRPFPIRWTAAWERAGVWADSIIRWNADPAVLMDMQIYPDELPALREQLLGAFRLVYEEEVFESDAEQRLLAETQTWSFGGRFAEAENYLPEPMFTMIRDYFYVQEQIGSDDRSSFALEAKQKGFRAGMELDYVMLPHEDFDKAYGFFPSEEDIPWAELDYVVVAVHPHSLIVGRDIVWDPERCFRGHSIMLWEIARLKDEYPHISFIWGHPFWYRKGQKNCETDAPHTRWGMPAFHSMNHAQMSDLVQTASAIGIPIEINIDWKAHTLYDAEGDRITPSPLERWTQCMDATPPLLGKFLDLIVANQAIVSVATDLHVYELDQELRELYRLMEGAQGLTQKQHDAAAYVALMDGDEIGILMGENYLRTPHVVRQPFLRLVTTVQMLLSAGISSEYIWNMA